MDVKYINPFIQAISNVFDTMLSCKAERETVGLTTAEPERENIVGMIGLSGPVRGTAALILPKTTALAVLERWLCTTYTEVDREVCDGVAELLNIITGQAKVKFSENSTEVIDLGLPAVIHGDNYNIEYPSKSTWLEINLKSELGPFKFRVSFEKKLGNGGAH